MASLFWKYCSQHLLCGTEVLIMRDIDAKFTADNSPKDNYILVHHLSYIFCVCVCV